MPSHLITAMCQLYRPNGIALTATKNMTIPNGIFLKKGLYILHMNVNRLLPKKIKFTSLQDNQIHR